MRYVEAGGARVSAVGLGTWQFGSRDWSYGQAYATEVAPALVRRALDLGITLFDTAEAYAFGRSERILGQALGDRRPQAFVATKLLPILPVAPVVVRRARASARRLGVGLLDLYQLHWPNPVVPLRSTMPALARLQDEGTVRHVGVSNFSLGRWQEAEAALGRPVLSNQVRFNLADRRAEAELVPWASRHDRLVIAYSPLAQGLLSGRYGPGNAPKAGVRASSPAFVAENLERARPLLATLAEVAQAHGATPSQVALAWLLRRPNVVVIPGASSLGQLEANVEAADLELGDDDDRALSAAADAYRPISGAPAIRAVAGEQLGRLRHRVEGVREGLRS